MPRFRFSLRAFLLLLFIASLIGSNLFTSWQLRHLRQENAEMRKELGRLVVADPTKVNLVALPSYEEMLWRWRIYVPKGRALQICTATQDIPDQGFPNHVGATSLQEGEYVLTVAIRKNRLQQWTLTVANPNSSAGFTISDDYAQWLADNPGWSSSQAGSGGTETTAVEEPFTLLRVRAMEPLPGGGSASSQKPVGEGVMIWIK